MLSKGLVEIVDGKPRFLRLIKPVEQSAATDITNPLSGEGLDLEESHEPQGDNIIYG